MKLIQIPVPFVHNGTENEEIEESISEFLDKGNYKIDMLYINPLAVGATNESEDKRVSTLRFMSGEVWNVLLPFGDLLELLTRE